MTAISPNAGAIAGGTQIVITGTHLTGVTGVGFGNAVAAFSAGSDTQMSATAPAGVSGSVDVTVTTANGTSTTSSADRFTYEPVPTVTSITPTSGSDFGGTTVVITGTGFTGANQVFFGDQEGGITVNSDTQITAVAPYQGVAGAVDVVVGSPGGASAKVSGDRFNYVVPPIPTVSGVSPNTGPDVGGTAITITGSGFSGATYVKIHLRAGGARRRSPSSTTARSPLSRPRAAARSTFRSVHPPGRAW